MAEVPRSTERPGVVCTGGATLVEGKSAAKATFSEPGEYVVQAIVDDSSLLSGTYCCWINSELKVTVTR